VSLKGNNYSPLGFTRQNRKLQGSFKADQKENIHVGFPKPHVQYTPIPKVRQHSILKRRITKSEYEQVIYYALKLGFDNVFVQEVNNDELTPDFNDENPFNK